MLFFWGYGDLLVWVFDVGGGELFYLYDEVGRLVVLINENGV